MRRWVLGRFLAVLTASAGALAVGCGKTEETEPLATPPLDSGPMTPCTPGAMKPAADGCNTCSCVDGNWACTDLACTACVEGEVRQDLCSSCECMGGSWSCTAQVCDTAECLPGEIRVAFSDSGQCSWCTCLAPSVWHCEARDCNCVPGNRYLAPDGCNMCSCEPEGLYCTEGGCDGRCPLPKIAVDCLPDPVYGRIDASDPCCRFACPSAVPIGLTYYPSLEECENPPLNCEQGFADCNGDPSDGCESNIRSSPSSCGGCGNVCSFSNASEVCYDGYCSWDYCDPGFADCFGVFEDGCETDLLNDPDHCSACGYVCAGPDPQCINASCAGE